jgi:hypothetical protein
LVASYRLSSALSLRWPVARRSASFSKPGLLQTVLDAHPDRRLQKLPWFHGRSARCRHPQQPVADADGLVSPRSTRTHRRSPDIRRSSRPLHRSPITLANIGFNWCPHRFHAQGRSSRSTGHRAALLRNLRECQVDAQLEFEHDASGMLVAVVLHQNGRDYPGRRA